MYTVQATLHPLCVPIARSIRSSMKATEISFRVALHGYRAAWAMYSRIESARKSSIGLVSPG